MRLVELLSSKVELSGTSIELIVSEWFVLDELFCDLNSTTVLFISSGKFVPENGDLCPSSNSTSGTLPLRERVDFSLYVF